ncbi:MAG: rhomboid family intramembrane serine protease [Candidatus Hadarchaeota archaeon]
MKRITGFPIAALGLAIANIVILALSPLPGTLEVVVQGLGTLYLLVLASLLERKIGPVKSVAVYILSGLVASLLAFALVPGAPYATFGALVAVSGVAWACILACPSDEISLLPALLLALPGMAYFAFLGSSATFGTLISYITLAFAPPIVIFVLFPDTEVPLLPFLVAWTVLQLGIGLYWMSAQVLAGGVLVNLLGLVGIPAYLLLRQKGPEKAAESGPKPH